MNKYNPENRTVRSADEIHHGLVNHPENINCREEKDLLCSWRRAYERHMNEGGSAGWRAFQKKIDGEQSQSMRALTLLAEREGYENTAYHTNHDSFLSMKWMLANIPPEMRIDVFADYRRVQENEIRLPVEVTKILEEGKYGTQSLCHVFIMGGEIVMAESNLLEEVLKGKQSSRGHSPAGPKLH